MEPAKKLEKIAKELNDLVDLVADRDGVQAEIFDRIDWKLLRQQKKTLEKVFLETAKGKRYNHLRGIGQLIDMLQSVAVEYEFQPMEKVYGRYYWDEEKEFPCG